MDKSTIAVVVGVLSFFWGMYVFFSNRKRTEGQDWQAKINKAVEPFEGLPKAVAEIAADLSVAKKQLEVFWKGVSFSSAQALHSHNTPELDVLLEKFQRDEIENEKELYELKSRLKGVVDDEVETPTRKKFAQDILTLIHVRFEIGGNLVESFRQTA